ncbi:MAG: CRISPR system precrRNA processing endoribonuclease RAMP protein Cas6 [Bacillota bacterium]
MLEGLRLAHYQFHLEAVTPVYVPEYKGSVLRGALGTVLRRVSCALRQTTCTGCMLRSSCPYGVIFESGPGPESQHLRNFDQVARPFVLRPPQDNRKVIMPGEDLQFTLVLIGRAIEYLPYFIVVFRELGDEGIGLRQDRLRGKAHLRVVSSVHPLEDTTHQVFDGTSGLVKSDGYILTGENLERWAVTLPSSKLNLEFTTITRLQHDSRIVSTPQFHILIRTLLRRFSNLAYFHHGMDLDVDFKGMIERAHLVSTSSQSIQWLKWERYSSRQKASMDLGGFIGKVSYTGSLGEYLGLLALGSAVNVGKNCTFGLGQYQILTQQ